MASGGVIDLSYSPAMLPAIRWHRWVPEPDLSVASCAIAAAAKQIFAIFMRPRGHRCGMPAMAG